MIREISTHSENTEFVANPSSRMILQLREYRGEDVIAPLLGCVQMNGKEIELPMDYELWIPTTLKKGDYLLSGELYREWSGKPEAVVGDLITRYINELWHNPHEPIPEDPVFELDLKFTGLEHCDSPNSGGFCTSNE